MKGGTERKGTTRSKGAADGSQTSSRCRGLIASVHAACTFDLLTSFLRIQGFGGSWVAQLVQRVRRQWVLRSGRGFDKQKSQNME